METARKGRAHRSTGGDIMWLTFLGKGGSGGNDCPTLLETDQDSFVVQGWVTDQEGTVEIPHLLTGFAKPDTFIAATLTDTGRGTFLVSGRPIADAETLGQLRLDYGETAIEVPKGERTFYGAVAARKSVA